MNRFRIPFFLLVLGLVALWLWKFDFVTKPSVSPPPMVPASSSRPTSLPDPLSGAFQKFDTTLDATSARQTLAELQANFKSMPTDEAVAWIRSFLQSGQDKPTGLSFEINADGSLKEWPTFRTFLLDALLAIDPAAAASLAREILTSPTTADEWALALRNVGKVETSAEASAYLRERTEALINNPSWQASPSIGYLNAFDVLVHTNAIESTPLLSNLIQKKDRKDLAHAGFLTLDRLVQKSPTEVLTRLAADTALQQSRPEMAAQQFARADLRDPAQQEIIKSWLLDTARSGIELRSFAGVYPNNNHFVSNNLLTTEAAPTGTDLTAHDREALQIVKSWQDDPEFQPIRDHLSTMAARLEQFTKTSE